MSSPIPPAGGPSTSMPGAGSDELCTRRRCQRRGAKTSRRAPLSPRLSGRPQKGGRSQPRGPGRPPRCLLALHLACRYPAYRPAGMRLSRCADGGQRMPGMPQADRDGGAQVQVFKIESQANSLTGGGVGRGGVLLLTDPGAGGVLERPVPRPSSGPQPAIACTLRSSA